MIDLGVGSRFGPISPEDKFRRFLAWVTVAAGGGAWNLPPDVIKLGEMLHGGEVERKR